MVKKRVTSSASAPKIEVRNVDLSLWKRFRKWVDAKGWKLGPTLMDAIREKMERDS